MIRVKILIFVSILFIVGGCSFSKKRTTEIEDYHLQEAAKSIHSTLIDLKEIESTDHENYEIESSYFPSSFGMDIPTSLTWNGSIEPLIRKIAEKSNYKLVVLGKRPIIPIIVLIDVENKYLGEILKDVAYQAGERAQIFVFPSEKIIQLYYINSS